MAHHVFGDTLDIHVGGEDLRFPHHDNELAQVRICMPTPWQLPVDRRPRRTHVAPLHAEPICPTALTQAQLVSANRRYPLLDTMTTHAACAQVLGWYMV